MDPSIRGRINSGQSDYIDYGSINSHSIKDLEDIFKNLENDLKDDPSDEKKLISFEKTLPDLCSALQEVIDNDLYPKNILGSDTNQIENLPLESINRLLKLALPKQEGAIDALFTKMIDIEKEKFDSIIDKIHNYISIPGEIKQNYSLVKEIIGELHQWEWYSPILNLSTKTMMIEKLEDIQNKIHELYEKIPTDLPKDKVWLSQRERKLSNLPGRLPGIIRQTQMNQLKKTVDIISNDINKILPSKNSFSMQYEAGKEIDAILSSTIKECENKLKSPGNSKIVYDKLVENMDLIQDIITAAFPDQLNPAWGSVLAPSLPDLISTRARIDGMHQLATLLFKAESSLEGSNKLESMDFDLKPENVGADVVKDESESTIGSDSDQEDYSPPFRNDNDSDSADDFKIDIKPNKKNWLK